MLPSTGLSISLYYKSTWRSHSGLLLSDLWKLHRSIKFRIFPEVLFCLFFPPVLFYYLIIFSVYQTTLFPINARMRCLLYNFCKSLFFFFHTCLFLGWILDLICSGVFIIQKLLIFFLSPFCQRPCHNCLHHCCL